MVTRTALDPVGNRLLLSLAADSAGFDILTDADSLQRAYKLVAIPSSGFEETSLGTFGPFDVVLSMDARGEVAIAFDGPELSATRSQAVVLYLTRTEAIEIFRLDAGVAAT